MSFTRIKIRRDTAANWTSNNPTLAEGELGVETGAQPRWKIGDGATAWNSLAYGPTIGVPTGGTVGQLLAKSSSTNYDTEWQSKLSFDVRDYGAAWDGTTDDTTAIQNAIDACAAAGGGYVDMPEGRGVISATLVLPSKVRLRGQGSAATEIYLANGSNVTMVKTEDFDTLVGTDTWLVADGNKWGFGFIGLRLHGNKANQTSGSGVQAYGKRFFVHDLVITHCKEVGWHSESNATIPGSPEWMDIVCEGTIDDLSITDCDSHGFLFRGQHDTVIQMLHVGVCGGWGARFESDLDGPSYYSGSNQVVQMHVFACTSGGIYTNAASVWGLVTSEHNFGPGLVVDVWHFKCASVELYKNCRTTGTYQASFNGRYANIGYISLKDNGESVSGVEFTDQYNTLGGASLYGEASTGTGLKIDGRGHQIRGVVVGYSGSGGIGLRTGASTALTECAVDVTVSDCATGWTNSSAGARNTISVNGRLSSGQTSFSGSSASTTETWTSRWDVNGTPFDNSNVPLTNKANTFTVTSAATSTDVEVMRLKAESTGTPAVEFGSSLAFEVETAPGNMEVGAKLRAVVTDITGGSEDFAVALMLMTNGAAAAERFRFHSWGAFTLGTAAIASQAPNSAFPFLQVHDTNGGQSGSMFVSWQNTAGGGSQAVLAHSKSGTQGTHTTLAADDTVGEIWFAGSDGTAFRQAALIRAIVSSTVGANSVPGRILLYTTEPSGTAVVEQLRIDNLGVQAKKLIASVTGAFDGIVVSNADAGRSSTFEMQKGATRRWLFGADASTESGSNAGSDFFIARYSDAGSYIDAPLVMQRWSGNLVIHGGATFNKQVNFRLADGATSLTFALVDAFSVIRHNSVSAHTYTIPPNADVAFPLGTQIFVLNPNAGGTVTIARGTGVTLRKFDGSGTDANISLTANRFLRLTKYDTNDWYAEGG